MGDISIGAEQGTGSIGTGGDTVVGGPNHSVVIPVGCSGILNISELVGQTGDRGLTGGTVQEGHKLSAGNISIGAELSTGSIGTSSNTIVPQEVHGVCILIGLDIAEISGVCGIIHSNGNRTVGALIISVIGSDANNNVLHFPYEVVGTTLLLTVNQEKAVIVIEVEYIAELVQQHIEVLEFRTSNGTYVLNGVPGDVINVAYHHLIKNTDRPIYFTPMADMEMPKFTDKLYSEGLVVRYSEKPYDNLAIKRKNYEELYLTDYLRESFLPESYPAATAPFNFNYIPCFKSLLDHYKQSGNTARYNELRSLMVRIVEKIDVPDEEKQKYYEEINR
jgi:hypothetical protein